MTLATLSFPVSSFSLKEGVGGGIRKGVGDGFHLISLPCSGNTPLLSPSSLSVWLSVPVSFLVYSRIKSSALGINGLEPLSPFTWNPHVVCAGIMDEFYGTVGDLCETL